MFIHLLYIFYLRCNQIYLNYLQLKIFMITFQIILAFGKSQLIPSDFSNTIKINNSADSYTLNIQYVLTHGQHTYTSFIFYSTVTNPYITILPHSICFLFPMYSNSHNFRNNDVEFLLVFKNALLRSHNHLVCYFSTFSTPKHNTCGNQLNK